MADLTAGVHLNQFLAPQLLQEFKNYNDEFIKLLNPAPSGAISADGIRRNKLINNVQFSVNNTADFVAAKMNTEKNITPWDKLDTSPTEVDDAEIRSLSFDKRSAVRVKHSEAWKIGVRDYALHKLAPTQDAAGLPVLRTTGAPVGAGTNGRLKLTYADLIRFYAAIEALPGLQNQYKHLQLCSEHHQDLIEDRANTNNYRDIVINQATGALERFYTLKLHFNLANVKYTPAGVMKANGAVAAADDRNSSVFFYSDNTVFHVNAVKILYKPETLDTTSADPKSTFRLQTYGLCDKVQPYGFGAIVSGNGS